MKVLRCDRGVAAIEFAVIGMLAIVLTVAAFEMARALYVKHQLTNLADAAARTILLDPDVSDATLQSDAADAFTAGDPAALTVALDQESVRGTSYRVVEISFTVTLLVPNLVTDTVDISVLRRVPQL